MENQTAIAKIFIYKVIREKKKATFIYAGSNEVRIGMTSVSFKLNFNLKQSLSLSVSLLLSVYILVDLSCHNRFRHGVMGMVLWRLKAVFWLAPHNDSKLHNCRPDSQHSITQQCYHGHQNELKAIVVIGISTGLSILRTVINWKKKKNSRTSLAL